jgi:hypothetical protein
MVAWMEIMGKLKLISEVVTSALSLSYGCMQDRYIRSRINIRTEETQAIWRH